MAIESNKVRKYTVSAKDSNPFSNIPHEIIVDILLRLPVKSLLRVRRVCKSLRSLISDPKFVQTQLSIASSSTDYTHHRLLLFGDCGLISCSVLSIMHEHSDTAVSHHYSFLGVGYDSPLHAIPQGIKIVDSCNGLVMLAVRTACRMETLFIWNPSTGESRRLPGIQAPYGRYWKEAYGFGYAESIDDYKVVLIFRTLGSAEYQNMVVVYTLRTNSWRRIGDFPHPIHSSVKFVSGALHWKGEVESKEVIVSLDLAKETYGEVSQPANIWHHPYWTIDVLGGCLCMLFNSYGRGAYLWVMKEYGVRESWTMLVAIHDATHALYGKRLGAKCILKNGDVLMNIDGYLVRYNQKDGAFSYPKIYRPYSAYPYVERVVVYPYIESLVSPYTDANSNVEWQQQY